MSRQEYQTRRSCRVALSVPILVFGFDYRGVVFSEEAHTLVINQHGAKIRMIHQLLPDSEIRLISHATKRESLFRVVSKLQSSELKHTYWGVENLEPKKNIWGVDLPALEAGDQLKVRATIQCPTCSARESLRVDETPLVALEEKGGVEWTCKICKTTGLWKLVPFQED